MYRYGPSWLRLYVVIFVFCFSCFVFFLCNTLEIIFLRSGHCSSKFWIVAVEILSLSLSWHSWTMQEALNFVYELADSSACINLWITLRFVSKNTGWVLQWQLFCSNSWFVYLYSYGVRCCWVRLPICHWQAEGFLVLAWAVLNVQFWIIF